MRGCPQTRNRVAKSEAMGRKARHPDPAAALSGAAPRRVPKRLGTASLFVKPRDPHREARHEADALVFWGGEGAVRLVEQDAATLTLERCVPGRQLWSVAREDDWLPIAAGVLRRLWREPPRDGGFADLEDEVEHWARSPRIAPLLDLARSLAASQDARVLCHQDLHGGNVLQHGDEWIAIDPKPVVGEREFDLASVV